MKKIYDDLWQSKRYIPFGQVETHAYLLQCSEANVLFYNTGYNAEIEHIAELGGIKYQYLSHRDEQGPSLKKIRDKFGSELCCHVKEQAAVSEVCSVDISFLEDQSHFAGIEIIHTPGHTDGSLSFLYDSPFGRRYLFTGDTFFQTNGKWQTFVYTPSGGTTAALIDSLKMYRELKPDVVIWSASGGGPPSFVETTGQQWSDDINRVIKDLDY